MSKDTRDDHRTLEETLADAYKNGYYLESEEEAERKAFDRFKYPDENED